MSQRTLELYYLMGYSLDLVHLSIHSLSLSSASWISAFPAFLVAKAARRLDGRLDRPSAGVDMFIDPTDTRVYTYRGVIVDHPHSFRSLVSISTLGQVRVIRIYRSGLTYESRDF